MAVTLMRMAFDAASGITQQAVDRAYVSGLDQIPWPCRTRVRDGEVQVERQVGDSGKFQMPFPVAGHGEVMLSTGTLMIRERPYRLEIELARGKLNQIRNQVAEWQAMGLVVTPEIDAALRRAIELFSRSVTTQHEDLVRASALARDSIVASIEVGDTVSDCYAEQALALRHRQLVRLPTLLGLQLDARMLPPTALAYLLTAFNMVSLPLTWRNVEAVEGEYQWQVFDKQLEWFQAHGVQIAVGPLVPMSNLSLPDWLCLWEGDFEGLLKFAADFVSAAVTRYRGRVGLWQCASRVNVGDALSLQEEQKLQLAVRVLETTRKLDPDTPAIICFDQPWGEYLRKTEFALSPLHFADALVRSGLQLGGIGLEINLGYQPGGTPVRDRLDFSRMLDLWSYLGLPLHLMITVPSSNDPDPRARTIAQPQSGGNGWTPEAQAAWVQRFFPLFLSKSYVQTITWNQFCDSDVHDFAHGGLFDASNAGKPAFNALAQTRKKHLH